MDKSIYEVVTECLIYDAETGAFFARKAHAGHPAGRRMGVTHRLGYTQVSVKARLYYAHRLAWLYTHGEWPNGEIDHINGDRADNRIANLRVVNRCTNMQNIRAKRRTANPSSTYLGVSRDQRMRNRPWRAVVYMGGKNYDCGYWATEEEAHAAYVAKKRELHAGCTL